MALPEMLRNRRFWLIAIPVVLVLALVVGPWLYINVLRDDPPERLGFEDVTTTTGDAAGPSAGGETPAAFDGVWNVGAGSLAGYRAKEVLFGQDSEAVGRTEEVTGTMEIAGTTVSSVEVSVDMASVTSPESRRDGQFRGRIMDVATYPTATFSLTAPIELGGLPADGEERPYEVTGDLTLRGVTRTLTFELAAKRVGLTIQVSALVPIDFDAFKIPDASGGPAKVGRNGELELLLVLTR